MSNVDKELASAIEILREQHRKLQTHVKYTGGNSTDIDIIHENIISALNNLNSVRAQLSQSISGYEEAAKLCDEKANELDDKANKENNDNESTILKAEAWDFAVMASRIRTLAITKD